jgi:hypothetical protein
MDADHLKIRLECLRLAYEVASQPHEGTIDVPALGDKIYDWVMGKRADG